MYLEFARGNIYIYILLVTTLILHVILHILTSKNIKNEKESLPHFDIIIPFLYYYEARII